MPPNYKKEIESLIKKAEECIKPGNLLKMIFWKPDHFRSAELYSEAGHKLKYLNCKDEAGDCYRRSAEEYITSKCSGYLFFAAEAYTNSYSQNKDRNLLIKACELYCMNNSYSIAANTRKQLLKEESAEEKIESLEFIIMCYEKAGMNINRMAYVEEKGVACVEAKRYLEAGNSFLESGNKLLAFLAYFIDGDEFRMKELDFEHEVIISFYRKNRAEEARKAIQDYLEYNGIKKEHEILFNEVLDKLKPENDIL